MHGNVKEDGGRAPWEEAESIPESEEETWARINEQGGREMFPHSSDQAPCVCADSTAWGWNAIRQCPVSLPGCPLLAQSPPLSLEAQVVRGQETTATSLGISHLLPAPTSAPGCSLLLGERGPGRRQGCSLGSKERCPPYAL